MIINDNIDHNNHLKTKRQLRLFKIRNVLNILFMVIAIVGVAIYFLSSHNVGIYVILAACVLKFVECSLRLIR